jgi:hypothetical protein
VAKLRDLVAIVEAAFGDRDPVTGPSLASDWIERERQAFPDYSSLTGEEARERAEKLLRNAVLLNEGYTALCEAIVGAPKAVRGRLAASGGENAAAARKRDAAKWHDRCVVKAREMVAAGRSPREVAAILAPQFGKSARSVREVLKKAEVK